MATFEKATVGEKISNYVKNRQNVLIAILAVVVAAVIAYTVAVTVTSKANTKGLAAIDTISYVMTQESASLSEEELEMRRNKALEDLSAYLEKEGYEVETANSAEEALAMNLSPYSLFIVDIMMERLSGFDFARQVKNIPEVEDTPLIFCSALEGEDDKVMGLNIGADDYITKPFVMSEVLARVRAVLRRASATRRIAEQHQNTNYESDVIYKTLRIDRNTKLCWLDGEEIQLTRTEYDIILFFLTHPNRIYSREEIINEVWGNDVVITNRTIDTNITRLRKKLGPYGNNIITRQGFGYGFKETD